MDASRDVKQAAGNPYVGPRPFQREEKDRFFGREREGRDLFSLVISERLVLFYAQSGAGKTSLINTRLVPSLEERGFEVLPVGRVSGELPPGLVVDNIFATNLMLKLDAGEDDPGRFQSLRLSDFLVNLTYDGKGFYYQLPAEQGQAETAPAEAAPSVEEAEEARAESQDPYQIWPRALIIDQFEELFTGHLEAWKKREDFFIQLAEALQKDPYLWVVLAMREDHVAQMEPYASLLPGGLRHRYYMQRLGIHAAMDAITQPVDKLRPFETLAAQKLAENLSRINAGTDASGAATFVEGESVEPVQLQVVCYQLWEALKNQPGDRITQEDLNRLARGKDLGQFVNQALADFYQDTLQKVLREPGLRLSEVKLRQWFSTELITETGTRGFVYMGAQTTGGIPNKAVLLMEGQLLRGESRAGGKWYELVHDRFIDPILQSNLEWTLAQQKPKRMFYVGAGAILLVVILFAFLVYNTGRNQTAQAQQTAQSNAAQAAAAIEVAQNSRDTTINLAATYDEVNKTLEALSAKSTVAALEAQLAGLQSTPLVPVLSIGTATREPLPLPPLFTQAASIPTAGSTPDELLGTQTPTPIIPTATPTFTPSVDPRPTYQAETAIAVQAELYNIQATQTALANPNPVRELIIGQTSKKTSIWATQLGTGKLNIVLVGGLHAGFAPASVDLANEIAAYYSKHLDEIPPDVRLHIIAKANPDSPRAPGRLPGRLNAKKVDLNRNWDCDWKEKSIWGEQSVSGGSAPFSELETQALREYFVRNQPVAVVVWEARAAGGMASPGGCGKQSLFSESLAKVYGGAAGYTVAPFEAYAVTGDITNWLDSQGIPAISVLLPDYEKVDAEPNLRAVQFLMETYTGR